MTLEDGHFGESVAATHDETSDKMFEPAVVGPTVDFLADLGALAFGIVLVLQGFHGSRVFGRAIQTRRDREVEA
jgi:hypothetical protein